MARQRAVTKPTPKVSLAEYIATRAKRNCPVCQLPATIRDQLGKEATRRGFSRLDQLAWLREACGYERMTADLLRSHFNAHHDEEAL